MMNARKIEKWVLLEQSGELSSRRKKLLDTCPEAEEIREELHMLKQAIPSEGAEPSPWAVTRIQARLQDEPRSVLLPARARQVLLGAAASLALVVTLFVINPASVPEVAKKTFPTSDAVYVVASAGEASVEDVDAWDLQFEEDLAELEVMILDISDTSFELAGM